MKIASSSPETNALVDAMPAGLNHSAAGFTEPAGASLANTRTSATTENRPSVISSAASSPICVFAFSSMPMTQIHVIAAMKMTPRTVTASVDASSTPNSRNV